MKRILVLRGGALGDFIVTLPALAMLRDAWPDARIELIGNAVAAELGREAKVIDAAHSQHDARWAPLFERRQLPGARATWLGGFDLVVNYWPDRDGALRSHFPARDGQAFISAEATPTVAPAARHYCEPVREFLSTGRPRREIAPLTFRLRPHRPDASGVIAVHPGSGSTKKNWPLDRWDRLCRWLREERGARLAIVSGEAEPAGILGAHGEAWRALPLPALADNLSRCRYFIGHDSGVSHLAAACGVPSLLLFGPTDPGMWAPPSASVKILRKGETMEIITVADVRAAFSQKIPS